MPGSPGCSGPTPTASGCRPPSGAPGGAWGDESAPRRSPHYRSGHPDRGGRPPRRTTDIRSVRSLAAPSRVPHVPGLPRRGPGFDAVHLASGERLCQLPRRDDPEEGRLESADLAPSFQSALQPPGPHPEGGRASPAGLRRLHVLSPRRGRTLDAGEAHGGAALPGLSWRPGRAPGGLEHRLRHLSLDLAGGDGAPARADRPFSGPALTFR